MLRKEVEQMKFRYGIEKESQLKSQRTEEKLMTTKTTGCEKGLGTKGSVIAFLERKSRQASEQRTHYWPEAEDLVAWAAVVEKNAGIAKS
ncbi:unnamed protein product [Angiostrongylus costaricensis]|uniref:Transposase n=1 Tax=Angiostrongylus costaricensis TaxID=334426 RepID=A0A0R3Q1G5_ANGCS|nr:unnamed protein product [Angiostrongylus costaricensis]